MIVLNFSHPLTAAQLAQVTVLVGQPVDRTIEVSSQLDVQQPLAAQVVALADRCALSAEEWQTLPLLVIPPALSFVAVALLADLHGRCGYFPAHLRLRPTAGSLTRQYEVAEVLDLQHLRDRARQGRG